MLKASMPKFIIKLKKATKKEINWCTLHQI